MDEDMDIIQGKELVEINNEQDKKVLCKILKDQEVSMEIEMMGKRCTFIVHKDNHLDIYMISKVLSKYFNIICCHIRPKEK